MYVSRLCFRTRPGASQSLQERLGQLCTFAAEAGAVNPRVLRAHFASDGATDVLFEEEAADLATLEQRIEAVKQREEFQRWSEETSELLARSPKREIYVVA